jgi:protein SCO1/2
MMVVKLNRTVLIVTLLLAFIALIAGLYISQQMHMEKKIDSRQFHGTLLQKPREIKPFSLIGIDNQLFDNQTLYGSWTVVFFGFTRCGYLCPTTMAELAKMYHLLEQKGVKPLPAVVMVSIDPKRDSLVTLKDYVQAFDSHFYGARGEDEVIEKITREMGIAYSKVFSSITANANDYDVQHNGALMLFNPQAKLVAFFTTPHQAQLLAEDYQLLVK